jgi:hypothetical protein
VLSKAIAQSYTNICDIGSKFFLQRNHGCDVLILVGDDANRIRMHFLLENLYPKKEGGTGLCDIHCFNLAL